MIHRLVRACLMVHTAIHAQGDWSEDDIVIRWLPSGRKIVPEVEREIDIAWADASQRLGDKLFDGPMCRLERWAASAQRLELSFSHTSYKPFLGTNLENISLADRFGPDVLANPVGISTLIQTSDNMLLLGRRNDSVAYYPRRVHPFAGAVEPREPLNVFDEVRRELLEEIGIASAEIQKLHCMGLVEDLSLRQPELICHAILNLSQSDIEARLDRHEHDSIYAIPASADALERASGDSDLTPVASTGLLLWGSGAFGAKWFDRVGRLHVAP